MDQLTDQQRTGLYAVVRIVVDQLEREELITQYLNQQLEGDPRPCAGYDKLRPLFTEAEGTQMSDLTQQAFMQIAHRTLFSAEAQA